MSDLSEEYLKVSITAQLKLIVQVCKQAWGQTQMSVPTFFDGQAESTVSASSSININMKSDHSRVQRPTMHLLTTCGGVQQFYKGRIEAEFIHQLDIMRIFIFGLKACTANKLPLLEG